MKEKIKKILKISLIAFIILTAMAFWAEKAYYFLEDEEDLSWLPCHVNEDIATIEIKGEIIPYFVESSDSEKPNDYAVSEDIVYCLNRAKQNGDVKAIILEINSRGGGPVASEEIMNAVKKLGKPSVAVISESAISGAYLIASAADKIFASEISDIGGIGVTMSYLDYSAQNKKEGVTYQELASGKFKNTGDPDKPLTAEEKDLIMRDLKISHEFFVKKVSQNRKLDIEKVKVLADGSSMLGQMAKENGLIDEIGDRDSAENWLSDKY